MFRDVAETCLFYWLFLSTIGTISEKYLIKASNATKELQQEETQTLKKAEHNNSNTKEVESLRSSNTDKYKQEDSVKKRIHEMARESKLNIDNKIDIIEKTHEGFKNYSDYKMGYIVSHINKTYENMLSLYQEMDTNENSRNVIETLNAYEQVKKTNEYISKLLKTLSHILLEKKLFRHPMKSAHPEQKHTLSSNIAWSYYDDIH